MTINIKKWRKITSDTWHICGQNDCENMVFGIMSVCLHCWLTHLAAHGDTIPDRYKYNIITINTLRV